MEKSETTKRAFLADMAAIEMELAARRETELAVQLRIINEDDATHCRICSRTTAGCTIAACHVQACDSCIIEWVEKQIGVKLV
jgi:hypothetical protein